MCDILSLSSAKCHILAQAALDTGLAISHQLFTPWMDGFLWHLRHFLSPVIIIKTLTFPFILSRDFSNNASTLSVQSLIKQVGLYRTFRAQDKMVYQEAGSWLRRLNMYYVLSFNQSLVVIFPFLKQKTEPVVSCSECSKSWGRRAGCFYFIPASVAAGAWVTLHRKWWSGHLAFLPEPHLNNRGYQDSISHKRTHVCWTKMMFFKLVKG